MSRAPARPGFVDDDLPPGAAFAAVVRSTAARGVVEAIDAEEASALPGVLAVLTADELGGDGHASFARGEVTWAGQPVALVVAEDRATAEDGAGLVIVEIDPADADIQAAAPSRADLTGGRLSFTITIPRRAPVPPEPPGCVATWEGGRCRLLTARLHPDDLAVVAGHLGVTTDEIEVRDAGVAPVAGSLLPAEVAAVAVAARRLDRPVAFARLRSDDLIAGYHTPGHALRVVVAFEADGTVRAIDVDDDIDGGAWCSTPAEVATRMRGAATGCYAIDVEWRTRIVTSATAPTRLDDDACTMVGSYVVERTLDRVAAAVGVPPVEIRRRHARDGAVATVIDAIVDVAGEEGALALVATSAGLEAHACTVEVDVETGVVGIDRYVASGAPGGESEPANAPTAVAAGIAAACFESARYDEDGQPTAGTLIDYLVPSAADLARVTLLAGTTPPQIPAPHVVVGALARTLGLPADAGEPSLPLTPTVVRALATGDR